MDRLCGNSLCIYVELDDSVLSCVWPVRASISNTLMIFRHKEIHFFMFIRQRLQRSSHFRY